jgi:predicted permease
MERRSSWRWLFDWQEAAKSPVRTLVFMFVSGVIGAAAAAHYIGGFQSRSSSIAAGFACGVVVVLVGLRSVSDPGGVVARATSANRPMLVFCAVGAVGLLVVGAALSDWRLAASAVPLAILSCVLFLVRHYAARNA